MDRLFNASGPPALGLLLPTARQTLLLEACLGPPERVSRAMRRLSRGADDLRRTVLLDRWGSKALLALLGASLERGGVAAEPPWPTALRAARLREDLRLASIRRIARGALAALAERSIQTVLTGDLALAEAAYPAAALRHCGEVRLLLVPDDVDLAVEALRAAGWNVSAAVGCDADRAAWAGHASGLALGLACRLLETPHAVETVEDVRSRSRERRIEGLAVRVPGGADLVLAAIGPALREGSWRNIQWVADAHAAVAALAPGDWACLERLIERNHLAAPARTILAYLAGRLGAPVPRDALERMAATRDDPLARDVAAWCAANVLRSNPAQALRRVSRAPRELAWFLNLAGRLAGRRVAAAGRDLRGRAWQAAKTFIIGRPCLERPARFVLRCLRGR